MSLLDSFLTKSNKISLKRPVLMQRLESAYKHQGYTGLCLYGQRQVGKTFLLNQFIEDKPSIYYQATEQKPEIIVTILRHLVAHYISKYFADPIAKKFLDLLSSCEDISSVLELIFSLSTVKPLVFIIDEYPYLLTEFPALDSVLQAIIDKVRSRDNFNITFIICGSSIGTMTSVLNNQSPLYMRLEPLEVKPFTFWESLPLLVSYSHEDAFKVYSVMGGYPGYLLTAADYSTFDIFLQETLLCPYGVLRSYVNKYLLSENLVSFEGEAIIEAIVDGKSDRNQIFMASKLSNVDFTKTFRDLLDAGVIASKSPLYSKILAKSRSYYINVPLLAFWSYFFGRISDYPIDMAISRTAIAEGKLNTFLGTSFESICRDYILTTLQEPVLAVGYWEDKVTTVEAAGRDTHNEEIDVCITLSNRLLLGECKWTTKPIDSNIINKLFQRASYVDNDLPREYYFFSCNGFDSTIAISEKSIHLVSFDDMFS